MGRYRSLAAATRVNADRAMCAALLPTTAVFVGSFGESAHIKPEGHQWLSRMEPPVM